MKTDQSIARAALDAVLAGGEWLPYCLCPWCPPDARGRMPIRERHGGRLMARCEKCGGVERVNMTDITSAVHDGREAVFPGA